MQSIKHKISVMLLFFLFAALVPKSQNIPIPQKKLNMESKKVNSPLLRTIIAANYDSLLPVSANTEKYELQIIYTQIDRERNNNPIFTTHYYGLENPHYFYPASLVKLPVAALSLERIRQLNIPGLDKDSYMLTDSLLKCLGNIYKDSSSTTGYPSIANYIKKILLVSDNVSYSRLYEFLGVDYIQSKLENKSLGDVFIVNKFNGFCSEEDHKQRLSVVFMNSNFDTLYIQKPFKSDVNYLNPLGKVVKGKRQMTNSGKIISQPKNFTNSNYMKLIDIDDILKRVIFPINFSEEKKFDLGQEDYIFLKKYMGMWPRESYSPKYSDTVYEDSYKKYLIYGNHHQKINSDSIRIFNIVGLSYGTVADCAYIVNKEKGIEFFLSAVVYVNKNEIMNDGKYEYMKIGLPFLSNLGKAVYEFEYKRKKLNKPNFEELNIDFTKP